MLEWPHDSRDAGDPLQRQTPFIGRATAFARLSQHLNTTQPGALVYFGAEGVGKTALLYAIAQHMTTNQIGVSVFIPLPSLPTQQNELALALYQAAYGALIADRGVAALPSRLPEPPIHMNGATDWMQWLAEVGLPGISQALRPNRRLIYLLDDAQVWIDALEQKTLTRDFPAALAAMIAPHSDKITLVFTLDQNAEPRLNALEPLIQAEQTMRLTQLTEDEIIAALNEARAASALYRWTGGHPALMTPYLRRETPRQLSLDHIEEVTPQIYSRSQGIFQRWWQRLTAQERRVLAAISTAQYIDPFKAVTAAEVQSWVVQTEHPMDMTAIQAALRGLEYRELIVYEAIAARGVRVKSDLFRRWLREHADLDTPTDAVHKSPLVRGESASVLGRLSRQQVIGLALVAAVLVGLILLVLLNPTSDRRNEDERAVPTVTLSAPTPRD